MRFALIILLALMASPLPAQQMIDRFPAGGRSELTPLQGVPDRPSPLTLPKVVGAVGGGLAGFLVGGEATYWLSGGAAGASIFGGMAGAAVGAGLGVYVPGESPPHAAKNTFAMAALGSLAGAGLVFLYPPLGLAAPPAGALIGFSMAY